MLAFQDQQDSILIRGSVVGQLWREKQVALRKYCKVPTQLKGTFVC